MYVHTMKSKHLSFFSLIIFAVCSFELHAETKGINTKVVAPKENKKNESTENRSNKKPYSFTKEKFVYNPPMRGAPAVRIGGGTRGIGSQTIELVVIAPDHTGLTYNEQPRLYWYISKPALAKLEVTLINDKSDEPVYENYIEKSTTAGIQSIDLSKTGIKLKPDLEYRWFVSAVENQGQRSNDVVASGMIKYVVPDSSLKNELLNADASSHVNIFMQNGIWYDAIDSLVTLSKLHPEAPGLREQKISLLKQVGLESVANYVQKDNQ